MYTSRFGPPLVRKYEEHSWPPSRAERIIHHMLLSDMARRSLKYVTEWNIINGYEKDQKFYGAEWIEDI